MPDRTRFAWAKLNAYGLLVAGLALLGGSTDLVQPGGANLARILGEVPQGQHFWAAGFAVSGLTLVYSLIRGDRLAETFGLGLLFLSLVAQTVVTYQLLGWSEFTFTRFALIAIVGGFGAARVSSLWSKHGLVITIPPRGDR